jgi:hypothetical protein
LGEYVYKPRVAAQRNPFLGAVDRVGAIRVPGRAGGHSPDVGTDARFADRAGGQRLSPGEPGQHIALDLLGRGKHDRRYAQGVVHRAEHGKVGIDGTELGEHPVHVDVGYLLSTILSRNLQTEQTNLGEIRNHCGRQGAALVQQPRVEKILGILAQEIQHPRRRRRRRPVVRRCWDNSILTEGFRVHRSLLVSIPDSSNAAMC